MITDIKKEFEQVINYAQYGKSNLNWDGLEKWIEIRKKYNDDYIESFNWSNNILINCDEFRQNLMDNLSEYKDGNINEVNHFIIQCCRIPIQNKLTLRRLMQVAYNIGQLQACKNLIDKKYMNQFYILNMDKIETYL
jgi:hypothetical protein